MSDVEPRFPLRQYLDLAVEEEQVPRMWKRIQRGSRRSPAVGRVAAVVAVAAAILILVIGGWPQPAPDDAGAMLVTSMQRSPREAASRSSMWVVARLRTTAPFSPRT